MKRWHQELTITLRNWRNHRRIHVDSNKRSQYGAVRKGNQLIATDRIGRDPYEVDCDCDEQIGRFRKIDAYDCGNTRCYMCHGDKHPKREKHEQELLSELSFREQLKEFLENDAS